MRKLFPVGLALPLALLLLAAPAVAAPVLDRVESELRKGRKLRVTVEATFTGAGELRLEGEVNGIPFSKRKRVRKASVRRIRFRVDARKLGLKHLAVPLDFDLRVTAMEKAGGSASRQVHVVVPLPLILLPGLGNEITPGSLDVFAAALALASPADYRTGGPRPNLIVHDYPSLSTSLGALGRELAPVVDRALRRTPFAKVDVVGYSMGGLVARSYMAAGGGAGRVRKLVFLGTPNEGTPLAVLPGLLRGTALLTGIPRGVDTLADLLLDTDAATALENFIPTYEWAFLGPVPVSGLLSALLPPSPLTALNALGPDPETEFHAFCYRDAGTDLLGLSTGTIDTVDFIHMASLATGGLDPTKLDPAEDLRTGPGDGVVPMRSVFMTDEPKWRDLIHSHDLGTGTHAGYLLDPDLLLDLVEILSP